MQKAYLFCTKNEKKKKYLRRIISEVREALVDVIINYRPEVQLHVADYCEHYGLPVFYSSGYFIYFPP